MIKEKQSRLKRIGRVGALAGLVGVLSGGCAGVGVRATPYQVTDFAKDVTGIGESDRARRRRIEEGIEVETPDGMRVRLYEGREVTINRQTYAIYYIEPPYVLVKPGDYVKSKRYGHLIQIPIKQLDMFKGQREGRSEVNVYNGLTLASAFRQDGHGNPLPQNNQSSQNSHVSAHTISNWVDKNQNSKVDYPYELVDLDKKTFKEDDPFLVYFHLNGFKGERLRIINTLIKGMERTSDGYQISGTIVKATVFDVPTNSHRAIWHPGSALSPGEYVWAIKKLSNKRLLNGNDGKAVLLRYKIVPSPDMMIEDVKLMR